MWMWRLLCRGVVWCWLVRVRLCRGCVMWLRVRIAGLLIVTGRLRLLLHARSLRLFLMVGFPRWCGRLVCRCLVCGCMCLMIGCVRCRWGCGGSCMLLVVWRVGICRGRV